MSSLNPSDTSIVKSVLTEPIPAPAEKTTVGKETDNNEVEENLIDYNEVDDMVNHSRETKRKILRDALVENGFALRNVLLSEPVINHYASPLAMEEMSVEDIMSEIPTEDLLHVGAIQDRIIMPASFAQKYILPTVKVRKALKLHADNNLPGGVETAMLFAIFDQSVMDLNRPVSENLAENAALRAMVSYTGDDSLHQFSLLKEGKRGLTKGLVSALQQLSNVTQLPAERELWTMREADIQGRKDDIAKAITQYEDHIKRDHANMQLLREQITLMAHLNWEQQVHICDLNERYLRLVEERNQIAQLSDKPIYNSVDVIVNTMKTLQESLNQRLEKMSNILTPVDMTKIMTSMTKLKSALSEVTIRNAQLVMRNNELIHELSFMPPAMREKIVQAKNEHSRFFSEQRTNPHYLVPEKETEFIFEPADTNDPIVSKLQNFATVFSVQDLLNETNDVMNFIESMKDVTDDLFEDQGNTTQDANSIAPLRVTKARELISMATDQNATKRSHDSIAYNGPRVRSSKIQRMSPSEDDINHSSSAAILKSTFTGMIAQSAYVQRTNSSFISQDGERFSSRVDKNPFAPVGQNIVAYNVTRGNASSSTDAPSIRPKSRTDKNAKKCKSRASTRKVKKGKVNLPKKRKDNIPRSEQCRRILCKDRGTHVNHRHVDCRFQHKDQGSRSDSQLSQVIYSALADFKSQSGGTENYQSQSAIRPGYDNLGGRGY